MDILGILHSTIRLASPIILISIGGLFSLKVDIFNLGLEAFALMGCFSAVAATYLTENLLLGSAIGVIVCVLYGLIYSFFVIKMKVNAVICAVAFITLTSGLTRYLMQPIFGTSGKFILDRSFALKPLNIGLLAENNFIGSILNNHTILVYVSIIMPFIIHLFLKYTKYGLYIRSIGLNPEAANAAGINVNRWRYLASMASGFFCGLAGVQLAMSMNLFNVEMTAGRGFTALAVLIMTGAKPIPTFFASLLFGFADSISNVLSSGGYQPQFLAMLPYGLALLAVVLPMIIRLIREKRKRKLGFTRILNKEGG
jgi:simple sugar transport system permease protein